MIYYDAHEWVRHLFDLKGSMVRQIFYRVLFCVVWSAVVVLCYEFLHPPLAINSLGHILIGVPLGLLLVFRTNASYDRFWEGRRLWGAIVNDCRNLGRTAGLLLAGDPQLAADAIRWTIAFPIATMRHLRGEPGTAGDFADMAAQDAQSVHSAGHPPLEVARMITRQFVAARERGLISDYVLMTLDQNVESLIDNMGGCERIHKTPLPFAYVVHLRRALIAYCYTLPFALLEPFGWITLAVVLLISYTLYGVEEIGVQIEDPFGTDDNDLPLEDICQTIATNLRTLIPGTAETAAAVERNIDIAITPTIARGIDR